MRLVTSTAVKHVSDDLRPSVFADMYRTALEIRSIISTLAVSNTYFPTPKITVVTMWIILYLFQFSIKYIGERIQSSQMVPTAHALLGTLSRTLFFGKVADMSSRAHSRRKNLCLNW